MSQSLTKSFVPNQLWASKLGSASCPGPPTIFTVLNCTVNLHMYAKTFPIQRQNCLSLRR